jgi:hypothetical protein
MVSAWGIPQSGRQGSIVVDVYERPVSELEACRGPSAYVGRKITIYVQWPLPPGSTHSTKVGTDMRPAIFVGAHSDQGSGGDRWEGELRVVEAHPAGGVFWMQAANGSPDGIRFRGHLDGDVRFAMCRL